MEREIRNERKYYFLDHNVTLCIYCFNINYRNSYYKCNKKKYLININNNYNIN